MKKHFLPFLIIGCLSTSVSAQQVKAGDLSTCQTKILESIQTPKSLIEWENVSKKNDRTEDISTLINCTSIEEDRNNTKEKVVSLLQQIGKTDIREITHRLNNGYTEKLDSFVSYDHLGNKLQGDFMTYDSDNQFIQKHVHAKWNNDTQTWKDTEIRQYKWDENGNLLQVDVTSIEFNSGNRWDYTYDANNNVLSEIQSQKDGNGTVTPSQKTVYGYDKSNNLTDQEISMYNNDTQEWVYYIKYHAEYNDKKEAILNESYSWNGSKWYGLGKSLYNYDKNGLLTMSDMKSWDNEMNDWVNFKVISQEFNDKGLLTTQQSVYWNKEKGDYSGCQAETGQYNTKAIVTYDDNFHQVSDRAYYDYEDGKGWTITTEILTDWTPIENDGWEKQAYTYMYLNRNDLTEKTTISRTITSINRKNLITHELVQATEDNGNTWNDYSEMKFKYWNDSVMIYDETIVGGINQAKGEYEVNDLGEILNSTHYLGSADGKDWNLFSYFEYEHIPGIVQTKKMGYLWNGTKFVKNFGDEYVYDLDIDFDLVNMGLVEVDWEYKMIEHYVYNADKTTDEWNYQVGYYHYSKVEGSSINDEKTTGIRVYPNPVADILNIDTEENCFVKVYNANGCCILETEEKTVDMSDLQSGLYLININGEVHKIVKK